MGKRRRRYDRYIPEHRRLKRAREQTEEQKHRETEKREAASQSRNSRQPYTEPSARLHTHDESLRNGHAGRTTPPTAPIATRFETTRPQECDVSPPPWHGPSVSSGPSSIPLQMQDPAQLLPKRFESLRKAFPAIISSKLKHDPRHDCESNENVIFNTEFQKVDRDLRAIWRGLRDVSKGQFEDIHQKLNFCGSYTPAKPQVGVCGDSGQGKSRLIGALLGDPDLVVSAQSGRTATRVPIKYRRLEAEDCKYRSEVKLMSWAKFKDRVERSLRDLIRGLFMVDQLEEGTEVVYASAQLAREFFRSLFKSDIRWHDDQRLRLLLDDAKDAENKAARAHITDLAKAQYDTVKVERNVFIFRKSYTTSESMWTELFPWAFGTADSLLPIAPWPMVENITIRSHAEILQHISLIDLPGLDDHSSFNIESTNEYLLDCHLQIVVNGIGRVIDGGAALRHIRESKERGGRSRKIILVATMKDNIGSGHGLHLHATFNAAEKDELQHNEIHAQNLANERDRGDRDYDQFASQWLKFRKLTLVVRGRDRRVIESWKTLESGLKVFPTSADHYERNVAGFSARDSIPLLPENTGIPRLLKYLAALRAENKFQDLYDYANVTLASQITSMRSRLQTKNSKSQVVSFKHSPRILADKLRAEFERSYDETIMNPLLEAVASSMDSWIDKAKQEHRKWQPGSGLPDKWHFNQHKAWVARHGDHSTKRRKHVIWNEHFLKEVARTLLPVFGKVEYDCEAFLTPAKHLLHTTLDNIKRHITDQHSQHDSDEVKPFVELINVKKAHMAAIVESAQEKVASSVNRERQCTTCDDFNHYFRESMHSVYDKVLPAARDGEPNWVARSAALDEELSDKEHGPFASIQQGLTDSYEKLRLKTVETICEKVKEEFDSLGKEFERWNSSQDPKPPAPERTRLTEQLNQLEQDRQKALQALNKLKAQYELRPERML